MTFQSLYSYSSRLVCHNNLTRKTPETTLIPLVSKCMLCSKFCVQNSKSFCAKPLHEKTLRASFLVVVFSVSSSTSQEDSGYNSRQGAGPTNSLPAPMIAYRSVLCLFVNKKQQSISGFAKKPNQINFHTLSKTKINS